MSTPHFRTRAWTSSLVPTLKMSAQFAYDGGKSKVARSLFTSSRWREEERVKSTYALSRIESPCCIHVRMTPFIRSSSATSCWRECLVDADHFRAVIEVSKDVVSEMYAAMSC